MIFPPVVAMGSTSSETTQHTQQRAGRTIFCCYQNVISLHRLSV